MENRMTEQIATTDSRTEFDAKAAESGQQATERYQENHRVEIEVSTERVNLLAVEVLNSLADTIRRHKVSYDEFQAVKGWLIQVGLDGEWPLFMDVWVEHVIEDVATEARHGNKGAIEGPYYVAQAPSLATPATLPMRADEAGTPLLFQGTITTVDGTVLPGATVEIWHADSHGFYSQYSPGLPEWNLRGTVIADEHGRFQINTIEPAPYQVPTDGACGKLIAAAGWHAWRPAHLHLKVSAPGQQLLTAQLYFTGDRHLSDDIASAVKPELILSPTPVAGGPGEEVTYDFVLDPISA
ncbi:catechol 1,2-dioxygenase [Cryobacterium sp. Hz9]|nr:catechol 1,2-dioxygenase [Cryobacterium sp. Hz9]